MFKVPSIFVCCLLSTVTGAVVMSTEMAGARLISTSLGNSIYTWASLIAIVLMSLSAGAYVGGALAAKHTEKRLFLSVLIAAGAVALIPSINALSAKAASGLAIPYDSLVQSAALFVFPNIALGAVVPMLVKVMAEAMGGHRVGFAAGLTGMLNSVGSFVGTLLTPFVLIPHLPLNIIFAMLAGLLLLVAVPLFRIPSHGVGIWVAGALVAFGFSRGQSPATPGQGEILFQRHTPYHLVTVREDGPARFLYLDTTTEGGIIEGRDQLPLDYQNQWRRALELDLEISRALCVGAGAFGVPIRLSEAFPAAEIDVVEIDPVVVEVGYQFFGLGDHPRVHPFAADGRRFLERADATYDFIFLDAYHGLRYIPPHLTTVEFFKACEAHLSGDGVVMMNVITALAGDHRGMFDAFGNTLGAAFPHVAFIPVRPGSPTRAQNVLFLGSANKDILKLKGARPFLPDRNGTVMTDQQNPVEALLADQLADPETAL